MSRIIIKQLPKNITEEKLRVLFGSKGHITDIQLKYTQQGVFRQFAFIGYRTEDEAQSAVKFYNGTCIQTNRIKVELCAALGDEDKPQSWSKYAKDSTTYKKINKVFDDNEKEGNKKEESKLKRISKFEEIIGGHKDDPEFKEFMKVHDKTRVLWGNDVNIEQKNELEKLLDSEGEDEYTTNAENTSQVGNDGGGDDEADNNDDGKSLDNNNAVDKLAKKEISDLEYMKSLIISSSSSKEDAINETKTHAKKDNKAIKSNIDLFTIKMHNVPYKVRRPEIFNFFKPLKPYSVRLPTKVHGFCYVGFKTQKDMAKAMLKDKSFIKGKQVFFSDFTEKNKISKSKLDGKEPLVADKKIKNARWVKQEENVKNEENISESGKIFFRNLAYTVTEEDLQKVFSEFGPIAEIILPVDAVTRQIKAFGTVTFVMPEHAVKAFNALDGTCFHGRLLHLIPGKSNDSEEVEQSDAGLSFKEKRALKLKKTAQQSVNWNTLFLGANAVADILARKFETSKETILDTNTGGSSAAVRIALGETQIVIEMKKFLEENGVSLSAFDGQSKNRSKTVIMVKNLPADTTVSELSPLFAKFGPIGRIVFPPSGVTALVEFCDSSEAKQAFKKLAYSKFKNLPLYLEWAPENTFKTTITGEIIAKVEVEKPVNALLENNERVEGDDNDEVEEKPSVQSEQIDENDCADDHPEPNTTLFLRNLNFKTVKETVQKHFKHLGSIHTVEIAKRRDAENPKTVISLGYGFIQFKKTETAERALRQMQFTTIDGNQVELKRSDRTLKTADNAAVHRRSAATKQTGTKILVRNVPFQAKDSEVKDIFKAFGELRSLRLPLKMASGAASHRGFGFVDFVTKSDAKKAFEALSESTHLYGRRLVLEWASTTEDDVGELRKRTAQSFHGSGNQTKRNRKAIFDTTNIETGDQEEDENAS